MPCSHPEGGASQNVNNARMISSQKIDVYISIGSSVLHRAVEHEDLSRCNLSSHENGDGCKLLGI